VEGSAVIDPNYTLARIRELIKIELHTGELTLSGVQELCLTIVDLDEAAKAGNLPRDWIPF
jgi:hypothetical protein